MMAMGFHYRLYRQDFRLAAVLLVLFLGAIPKARSAEPDYTMRNLLDAIRMVEGWQGRPGAAGEIGPWQMLPSVRAKYLTLIQDLGPAFAQAQMSSDESLAQMHIWSIQRELRRRDAFDCAFNIALCWNAGTPRALSGRAEERHYDYARRVEALCRDLPARRSAAGQLGVGDLPVGMSLAGITFVPVLHAPSGASLTEHHQIAALCSGSGVSPLVPGGLGLQTRVKPGVIPYAVTGAVECRTGWPCRDTGHLSPFVTTSAGDVDGCPNPAGVSERRNQFRTVAAMPRWQRRPLVEATVASLS
jgi:hypothetical protein